MIATIIIVLLLAAYVAYILRRRYREIKDGKYCGCSGCSQSCGKKKKKE